MGSENFFKNNGLETQTLLRFFVVTNVLLLYFKKKFTNVFSGNIKYDNIHGLLGT